MGEISFVVARPDAGVLECVAGMLRKSRLRVRANECFLKSPDAASVEDAAKLSAC